MGVTGGVQPVLNPNTNDSYSVWQVQGYTVLDLSQFSDAGFTMSLPLMLTHPKHAAEQHFRLLRRGRSLLHGGVYQ